MSAKSNRPSKPAAARMVDVARRAGVSSATVSRALAGTAFLSEETAARVARAIQELGYTPNAVARSLRMQESKIVIVIVPDVSNAFFSVLLRGIEEQAHASGYSVLIGNAANDPKREAVYAQQVAAKRADGLILINGRVPDFGPYGTADQVPMVVVSEKIPGSELPTVCTNDIEAAREAVEHLIALGHTRIGCIAGPDDSIFTTERVLGYAQALRAANLAPDAELIANGDFTIPSGARAAARLLGLDRPPTAVFGCNDEMAIGAIQAAKARDLQVPSDLSVVGFDDIPFAATYDTPLTTVSQPFFAIGQAAMTMLGRVLASQMGAPEQVVLRSTLVVRDSTAPPRAG